MDGQEQSPIQQKIIQAEQKGLPPKPLSPLQEALQGVMKDAETGAILGLNYQNFAPKEHRRDRQGFIDRLPPAERARFQETFAQIDQQRELLNSVFDGELTDVLKAQETLLQSELNPEQRQAAQRTVDYLTRLQTEVRGKMQEFLDMARRLNVGYALELGASKRDRYTGLFLRTTVLDEFNRRIFGEYLKDPDSVNLDNHVVYALDMNNFKAGNTLLGHDMFDEFIAEMSRSFITTSQYLVQGHEGEFSYGQYNANDETSRKTIDSVFPPGEKRELLEAARTQGVVVEFYRDKSGADEALMLVHYEQGITPEREQMAEQLINTVFRHHALPKQQYPELAMMVKTAESFPNRLHIESQEIDALMKEYNIDMNSVSYLNKVAGAVRLRLMRTRAAKPIKEDRECRIRMGASWSKMSMSEAWNRFLYGINPDGSPDPEHPGLMDRKTGKWNYTEVQRYTSHVYGNVRLALSALNLPHYQEIAGQMGHIDQQVQYEASNPIIGNAVGRLFHEVEEVTKPNDKMDLILSALGGDGESLYQLASLVNDGRILDQLTDPKTRLTLLMALENSITHLEDEYPEGYKSIQLQQGKATYEAFLGEKGMSREAMGSFASVSGLLNKQVRIEPAPKTEEELHLEQLLARLDAVSKN